MKYIKPCPFCGGKEELDREGKGCGEYWISCDKCGATVSNESENINDIIIKWNKRI